MRVDAGGDVVHGLTHQQRWDVAHLLDDFDAAPDIAFGVFEILAGFQG